MTPKYLVKVGQGRPVLLLHPFEAVPDQSIRFAGDSLQSWFGGTNLPTHATQRLKEALARRKLRFSSNCQNDSEIYFQRDIFFEKPRSKNDWLDLIASWSPFPSTS